MDNKNILEKLDISLLILIPILSVVISLTLETNFFISTLLFFGLPSLWLSIRTPSQIKRVLLFSLILIIPLCIIIDYIATKDYSWFVPITIFPFRLFGIIPIEDLIWGFFLNYNIIIFYEHFFGNRKDELINKRMIYLILPLFILLLTFFAILFISPNLLMIPYAYLWIGIIIFTLPIVTVLLLFPNFLSKYLKVASYFFIVTILAEITGLQLNQWSFPGNHFIGWVDIFGYIFPFEEFFFLCILGSTAALSYYQFFDNDRN